MSDLVFPSFAALQVDMTTSREYATTVQEVASGMELRARQRSGARIPYELTILVRSTAPTVTVLTGTGATYATYASERVALETFFDLHVGRWDSFYFDDPDTAVRRRVRFDQDRLEFRRLVKGVYEAKVDLITTTYATYPAGISIAALGSAPLY